MHATLLDSSWLKRLWLVEIADAVFRVEYNGRGPGYESVFVNGSLADRRQSSLWFVPVFVFHLGQWVAAVEIRVWPWFTMRACHLLVEGQVLY
jgi:hypothetical protein